MVYIRAKKVKSDQYLYLVKSVWDSKKNTSKQEIVKYLGKASDVDKDDIPTDYRNDPKILSVLAKFNPKDIKKREEASKKSKQQLFQKLTDGDIQGSLKIYEDYIKIFNASDFFDKILKPVMYKVGDDWAKGKISIATEHVASNVAQTLVKIIMERVSATGSKKRIMICVPLGEEHHLGCDVIETYLSIKGFKIYNMGTSLPTESILSFIDANKPDVLLLSITLEDNLSAGQRLVRKIKDQFNIPILVGGFAFQSKKIPKFDAKIIVESTLEEIPRLIRTA
ncbi:cobalamin-dependent protein [Nitrosopumilus sp. K4]|uniref:cobalamin B12-binding domain-containing protein n=1 Tax=Nitrosopumilus sp. K4 TaxID=2795383 RepID=UPI001BA6363F|nr:B12-binding domain-containing protein [Nitrosopumilus sp. K4]QUC63986.1 cobalamin-dependent protein [Nitrosopumilus sp. K4]